MRQILPFAIVLCVVSCKEITFKEPQPRGKRVLREIPKELHGRYTITSEDAAENDTLIVNSKGYFVASDSTQALLSDTLILKKYNGYYFFNDYQNPEWLLRVIRRESNGNLTYLAMESDESSFSDFLIDLHKEIRIDSMEHNGKMVYQIDPAPKELMNLLDKGYFRKSLTLWKLPERNP